MANLVEPSMDLTLYQLLTAQLPEPPDLNVIQTPAPCPEDWPLILKSVVSYRKQVQGFVVSDGKLDLFCRSSLPELYEKVRQLELGTLIHLVGSKAMFKDSEKHFISNTFMCI